MEAAYDKHGEDDGLIQSFGEEARRKKRPFGRLGVDGDNIKWILKKCAARAWNGYMWLSLTKNDEQL